MPRGVGRLESRAIKFTFTFTRRVVWQKVTRGDLHESSTDSGSFEDRFRNRNRVFLLIIHNTPRFVASQLSMLLHRALASGLRPIIFFSPAHQRNRALAAFAGPRQHAIEQRLQSVFEPTYLEVINESHGRKEDESHFKVVVVSERFAGQRLLARHRAVNAALCDPQGVLPFHSLSVATAKTPQEWQDSNAVPASPKCAGGDGRGMKL